jgi:hypothetical protein
MLVRKPSPTDHGPAWCCCDVVRPCQTSRASRGWPRCCWASLLLSLGRTRICLSLSLSSAAPLLLARLSIDRLSPRVEKPVILSLRPLAVASNGHASAVCYRREICQVTDGFLLPSRATWLMSIDPLVEGVCYLGLSVTPCHQGSRGPDTPCAQPEPW